METPREVFQSFKQRGYRVSFHRIPISPSQAPSDRYIDEVVGIIKTLPTSELVVFNCGMGVGRTTYSMIIASLIRRAQHLNEGHPDPFISIVDTDEMSNKVILRLVYALEKGAHPSSA